MARVIDSFPMPKKTIVMYQETVETLFNNTLINDYFELLKKILNEGYTIIFKNDHDSDNLTEIKDVQHLKNYINNIQGYKFVV
jgi:hypothetical protein